MNIKYSKKKQELRKDPVLESIYNIKKFITGNSNRLITGVFAVVCIIVGSQIYSYMKESRFVKAQNDFGEAMLLYKEGSESSAVQAFDVVIENYKRSSLAAYSAYINGHIHLSKKNYTEAIGYFEKVLASKRNNNFTKGESLIALATCYEADAKYQEALDYYQKAKEDKTVKYRYPDIQWKMVLLYQKLGNIEKVEYYCNQLISDSLAVNYKSNAENLLATITAL